MMVKGKNKTIGLLLLSILFAGVLTLMLTGVGTANATTGDTHTLTVNNKVQIYQKALDTVTFRNTGANGAWNGKEGVEPYTEGGRNGVKITSELASKGVLIRTEDEIKLEADKTYTLRLKLRLENSDTVGQNNFPITMNANQTGNSGSLLRDTIHNVDWHLASDFGTEQLCEYAITGKASGAVQLQVGLADPTGRYKGVIYISDVMLVENGGTTLSVTEGSAIGELPAVPARTGYRGEWAIDGTPITADTVYDYTEDKIAEAQYAKLVTLKFETSTKKYQTALDTVAYRDTGAGGAWTGKEGVEAYTEGGRNGVKITSTERVGTLIHLENEWILEADKTYKLSFKLKMENSDTVGQTNFPIEIHALNTGNARTLLRDSNYSTDWHFASNNTTEKLSEHEIIGKAKGSLQLQINLPNDGQNRYKGVVWLSDVTLTEYSGTRTLGVGSAIGTLPEIPEREHYTKSDVWTIDGTPITAETVCNYDTDKIVKTAYTPIDYTLTFNDLDGQKLGEAQYNVETDASTIQLPDVPAAPHRSNGRWGTLDLAKGGNQTIVPVYDLNEYTITFQDEKGGTVGEPVTYTVETNKNLINLPSVPAKQHYTGVWTGWDAFDTAEGGDKTFTVSYTPTQYTLTFNGESGAVSGGTATYTVETDKKDITAPAVPAREHYTANGWQGWDDFDPAKGGNKTFTAMYTAIQYTVTFVGEDDATLSTASAVYGATVTIPEAPAKDGYTVKWMVGEDEFTAETTVTGDMTVKAVYTKEGGKGKGGCGSAVGGGMLGGGMLGGAIVLLGAAALLLRKKQRA